MGYANITSIAIPNSVESIGAGAFALCPSLTAINVSEDHPYFSLKDGILYDKNFISLIACPNRQMGTVFLPESVLEIVDYAFSDCDGVKAIVLPDGLMRIGNHAFEFCEKLDAISIPDSVIEIGENAFFECPLLHIRCKENSLAYKYAVENEVPYLVEG
jgi:hypothetical protein